MGKSQAALQEFTVRQGSHGNSNPSCRARRKTVGHGLAFQIEYNWSLTGRMPTGQVEKAGKGVSGRRNSVSKGAEVNCGARAGGMAAEVGKGHKMKALPARFRSWDLVPET